MSKPNQTNPKAADSGHWITNGKLARFLGIDPKTLRKWARRGLIPSYINRLNGYRYYVKAEVLKALRAVPGATGSLRAKKGL